MGPQPHLVWTSDGADAVERFLQFLKKLNTDEQCIPRCILDRNETSVNIYRSIICNNLKEEDSTYPETHEQVIKT